MPEPTIHTPHNESHPQILCVQSAADQQNADGRRNPPRAIPPKPCDYSPESDGLYMPKLDRESRDWVKVRLTNFTATIAKQMLLDDGQDVHRQYEIEAKLSKLSRK